MNDKIPAKITNNGRLQAFENRQNLDSYEPIFKIQIVENYDTYHESLDFLEEWQIMTQELHIFNALI